MSQFILHKENTRGHANHGWLNAHHSFSFANYYNSERMHFGALRVLNDDLIDGGQGFGAHPHDNMEIITIPLAGAIAHKDSMGNEAVIKAGEIQVMSAGTGVSHSEVNALPNVQLNLLQIWLFPNQKNVAPRYDQRMLDVNARHNNFQQILSPNSTDDNVWIHQDAWFSLGKFDADFATDYKIKKAGNGVYAFVISGEVTIDGHILNEKDGLGIWETDAIKFKANTADAEVLLMDVPMEF
ncbi:pirin family protein [Pedobacter changchengzhani]|uniref:Pirin family protein n=1 Tax=Pedobacter changchengzhani TaxID=2529274 RepID=A0A4R5MLH0_9SPHI|nr:pirin family protein [Pedobacter changchengzhani]TDG36316.1 pirin family protein [Pedobacter changchengzhani]